MSAEGDDREVLRTENAQLRARVAALETEAQRCKGALDGMSDAVVATDPAGGIVQMNHAAEVLTGWPESEAAGLAADEVFRFVDEATLAATGSPLRCMLQRRSGGCPPGNALLLARDGTHHAVALSAAPLLDPSGEFAGAALVVRDRTPERAAERALRQAEARFRTFFDNAPIGKCMTGPDGQLLRVNSAFSRLLGYSTEELQTISFASITHPDDLPESRECVRSLLAGEGDSWSMEKRYLKKDGHPVWTRVTTRLQRDEGGAPLHFLTHIQDITEGKDATARLAELNTSLEATIRARTAELQDAHELNHRILTASPIGVFACRADGPCVLANPAAARISGTSLEKMLALNYLELDAWRASGLANKVEAALATGVAQTTEIHMTTTFGRDVWLNYSIARFEKGGSPHFLMTVADVTARKLGEEELRLHRDHLEELVARRTQDLQESQDRLEEAQAVAHVGSWEFDVAQDKITGSAEFCRLFDAAPEQLTRLSHFIERLHPEDRERVARDVTEALEQHRPYDTDYRVRQRDGSYREISARGETLVDDQGAPRGMVGTCLDLTKYKQAERRAAEEEHKARTFLDSTKDLVTVVDAEGSVLYANAASQEFFGVPPETLLGQSAFRFIHPDDRPATKAAFEEWLQGGSDSASFENRQVAIDGTVRDTLWTVMPRYRAGRLDSIWSIARDITEAKRSENALRQLNEALFRSNRELEQFAYVASHDLQEPLRMVSSYTQLLAQRYGDQLDQDAKDFIGFAVDGANRMQRLIQDLLTFSRVTTRGRAPVELDAQDALGEAVGNLQAAIRESGALVTNGDLPPLIVDRTQLVQVFQNLLANGIKFQKGGEPPRVHVSAEPYAEQPKYWLIRVADNGIGIEPRHFERLFVIFQRLHGRQEYPGTGIGLALCKRIVERHGGQIWLESRPGEGTTVLFTLPSLEVSRKLLQ